MTVSYNSHNWTAKWWTQDEAPSTGGSGVWADNGACGGAAGPAAGPLQPPELGGRHVLPGRRDRAVHERQLLPGEHENPGYDPIISTWYWEPYTCSGGAAPNRAGTRRRAASWSARRSSTRCSRAGTRSTRTPAWSTRSEKYPAFATTGSDTVKKQEAAAFLANVNHETGGLVYVEEINQANWPLYCDPSSRTAARPASAPTTAAGRSS